jgi:hypothetical protein
MKIDEKETRIYKGKNKYFKYFMKKDTSIVKVGKEYILLQCHGYGCSHDIDIAHHDGKGNILSVEGFSLTIDSSALVKRNPKYEYDFSLLVKNFPKLLKKGLYESDRLYRYRDDKEREKYDKMMLEEYLIDDKKNKW